MIRVCEHCNGTGEVSRDEMDSDGNVQRGVLTEDCVCQFESEDEDPQGEDDILM